MEEENVADIRGGSMCSYMGRTDKINLQKN